MSKSSPGIRIPSDWEQSDGFALVTFCLPNSASWRAIAVGVIEDFSYGRFWRRDSGTITEAQSVGRTIFESMSICKLDELIEAIEGITAAIRVQTEGCGCTNGPGTVTDNGDIFFGSEPPASQPTSFGQPGDEFATEAEYFTYKCKIANLIVSGVVDTLSSMSALTLLGIAGGLAVIGVSVAFGLFVLPPMALLISLIVSGVLFATFQTIALALDARREELVCGLFEAITAQEAYNIMKAALEEEAGVVGYLATEVGLFSDFMMQLLPIDTVNKLFVKLELPPTFVGEIDCDVCGCVIVWAFETDVQGFIFTDTSPPAEGTATGDWVPEALRIQLHIPGANQTAQGEWNLDVTALGLTVSPGDRISVEQGAAVFVMSNNIGGTVGGSPESTNYVSVIADTFSHVFTGSGSLTNIMWKGANTSGGSGFDNVRTGNAITLELAAASPCPEP